MIGTDLRLVDEVGWAAAIRPYRLMVDAAGPEILIENFRCVHLLRRGRGAGIAPVSAIALRSAVVVPFCGRRPILLLKCVQPKTFRKSRQKATWSATVSWRFDRSMSSVDWPGPPFEAVMSRITYSSSRSLSACGLSSHSMSQPRYGKTPGSPYLAISWADSLVKAPKMAPPWQSG